MGNIKYRANHTETIKLREVMDTSLLEVVVRYSPQSRQHEVWDGDSVFLMCDLHWLIK